MSDPAGTHQSSFFGEGMLKILLPLFFAVLVGAALLISPFLFNDFSLNSSSRHIALLSIIIGFFVLLAASIIIYKEIRHWADAKKEFESNNFKMKFSTEEWETFLLFLRQQYRRRRKILAFIEICFVTVILFSEYSLDQQKEFFTLWVTTTCVAFSGIIFLIYWLYSVVKIRNLKSDHPIVAVGSTGFSILGKFEPWFSVIFPRKVNVRSDFALIPCGSIYVLEGFFVEGTSESSISRKYFVPLPAQSRELAEKHITGSTSKLLT